MGCLVAVLTPVGETACLRPRRANVQISGGGREGEETEPGGSEDVGADRASIRAPKPWLLQSLLSFRELSQNPPSHKSRSTPLRLELELVSSVSVTGRVESSE